MKCEVCTRAESTRSMTGIKMCERCYAMVTNLKNSDPNYVTYFSNKYNLLKASQPARDLINTILKDVAPMQQNAPASATVQTTATAPSSQISSFQTNNTNAQATVTPDVTVASGTASAENNKYKVETIITQPHEETSSETLEKILNTKANDNYYIKEMYTRTIADGATETVVIFESK